jgi:diguanylate cyclase (GGDEF)-like protein
MSSYAVWPVALLAIFPVIVAAVALGVRMGMAVGLAEGSGMVALSLLSKPSRPIAGLVATLILLVSAALIGRLRDLLDRSYRELDFRAVHDTITGLPNRALLLQRLSQAMRFSKRLSGRVSLLYIDLDRFQEINSTLGRAAGDAVLAETAARLTAIAGEREIVARVGGDEFAMVLPGAEEPEAFEIANKVVRMLSTRVDVGDVSVESSATVGIATSSDHTALEPEALLHQAELTLEGARSSRSGIAAYSPQISQGQGGLALLNELRLAIETGQLAIQYQPQVSLKTGKTIAMEGLIRWHIPSLGCSIPVTSCPWPNAVAWSIRSSSGYLEQPWITASIGCAAAWKPRSWLTSLYVTSSIPTSLRPWPKCWRAGKWRGAG